jgi:hypothetical protein
MAPCVTHRVGVEGLSAADRAERQSCPPRAHDVVIDMDRSARGQQCADAEEAEQDSREPAQA